MRISQMAAREPYVEILCRTLSRGWTTELGRPVKVRPAAGATGAGQVWKLQPLLSAYVPRASSAVVRRFLGDSFRFTPHRRRALPQWLAAGVLTTQPALRWATQPGFVVSPALPDASEMLVVPGNQRVRVFNFARRTSRVFLKDGFSTETMAREIAVRQQSGPFLPVLGAGEDARWLEEPLVDGWALPRCPPWADRHAAQRDAMRQLEGWLLGSAQVVDAEVWAQERLSSVKALTLTLEQRFPGKSAGLIEACERVAEVASGLPELLVAQTHGDFQAGNIVVERRRSGGCRRVWLIDWEHSRRRSIDYDRYTLLLGTRNATRLDEVWRRFLGNRSGSPLRRGLGASGGADTPDVARARLAMAVLEDVEFYLQESLTGPYTHPSDGLRRHMAALPYWAAT